MAWQAIVSSPEVAKENKHQIVETEHLMKALLEQKNGLARRIFSKAGVDNTRLLEATDKYIQRQPKVINNLTNLRQCSFVYIPEKRKNMKMGIHIGLQIRSILTIEGLAYYGICIEPICNRYL